MCAVNEFQLFSCLWRSSVNLQASPTCILLVLGQNILFNNNIQLQFGGWSSRTWLREFKGLSISDCLLPLKVMLIILFLSPVKATNRFPYYFAHFQTRSVHSSEYRLLSHALFQMVLYFTLITAKHDKNKIILRFGVSLLQGMY